MHGNTRHRAPQAPRPCLRRRSTPIRPKQGAPAQRCRRECRRSRCGTGVKGERQVRKAPASSHCRPHRPLRGTRTHARPQHRSWPREARSAGCARRCRTPQPCTGGHLLLRRCGSPSLRRWPGTCTVGRMLLPSHAPHSTGAPYRRRDRRRGLHPWLPTPAPEVWRCRCLSPPHRRWTAQGCRRRRPAEQTHWRTHTDPRRSPAAARCQGCIRCRTTPAARHPASPSCPS